MDTSLTSNVYDTLAAVSFQNLYRFQWHELDSVRVYCADLSVFSISSDSLSAIVAVKSRVRFDFHVLLFFVLH